MYPFAKTSINFILCKLYHNKADLKNRARLLRFFLNLGITGRGSSLEGPPGFAIWAQQLLLTYFPQVNLPLGHFCLPRSAPWKAMTRPRVAAKREDKKMFRHLPVLPPVVTRSPLPKPGSRTSLTLSSHLWLALSCCCYFSHSHLLIKVWVLLEKERGQEDITWKLSYNPFPNTKCSPTLGFPLYRGHSISVFPKVTYNFCTRVWASLAIFWLPV